eukprot:TRINITY_DN9424_c0_g1_i2.p1 TRINITY_DN9424_c0_g1~~TRINITY_DN9424_c0_g1_i2.p1  ORF type:complete len:182 (+),score=43.90 TRINITY_DN9424_c0_g1_i2:175-720(+)
MCERILEEEGVWQFVRIASYDLRFVPLEDDVLTLDLPKCLREISVEGDKTSLLEVATSLNKLQKYFGKITNIQGFGCHSLFILESLLKMGKEAENPENGDNIPNEDTLPGSSPTLPSTGKIDRLILVDRLCDLVTPCLSQLTYEGLIDEIYGIRNSCVELPAEMVTETKKKKKKKKKSTLR